MNRVAFKMHLYEGRAAEYKKRHDEIWPELSRLLKKVGISDYSIFLDEETNTLFATLKAKNLKDMDMLPATEIMQKWWASLVEIMPSNPDNSPIAKPLTEVFYLP